MDVKVGKFEASPIDGKCIYNGWSIAIRSLPECIPNRYGNLPRMVETACIPKGCHSTPFFEKMTTSLCKDNINVTT